MQSLDSGDATATATATDSPAGPGVALDPARGQQIGRFTLLEEVGRGAMGVVWSAYDPELDRKVALKFVARERAMAEDSAGSRGRFRQEAKLMAQLRHPNVVTLYEVGPHGEGWFLAMEYVSGGTLGEFAAQHRGQPEGWKRILAAFVDAARGMEAAHALGIIHGDFKPANVLVDEGRPQVADFGLARRARGEAGKDAPVSGTPRYMAPELDAGTQPNARTDQFAFCVSLYEALFGESPFEGDTALAYRVAVIDGSRRPPPSSTDVPSWVLGVIDRGLRADAELRWDSMAQLADTLESPERAGIGKGTRAIVGLGLTAMVLSTSFLGFWDELLDPFSSYSGVVFVPSMLFLAVVASSFLFRRQLAASAFNRKLLLSLGSIFGFDAMLAGVLWWLGVPVEHAHTIGLAYWAASAGLFGVAVHSRALWLSLAYTIACAVTLAWPSAAVAATSIGNLMFAVTAYGIWKDPVVRSELQTAS